MDIKTCCITGHRVIDTEKIGYVECRLKQEIVELVGRGYTHFISGFADGVDLIFADTVAKLKDNYPNIILEAAIPYRSRLNTNNTEFQRLIACCDMVGVVSEKYSKYNLMNRNRFMVKCSQLIIAVYDGRGKGGTLYTMKYAKSMGKEIIVIEV